MKRMNSHKHVMEECRDLSDILYEWVRNDGKTYTERVCPILENMQTVLEKGAYKKALPAFAEQFGVVAYSDDCIKRLCNQLENEGEEKRAAFLKENRFFIGRQVGPHLEQYYRIELCLHLKLGIISNHYCDVCSKGINLGESYGGSGGKHYCSPKCYDTLFVPCHICGQKNMTCLTNLKTPFIDKAALEQACDACLLKKYNLSIVCISCS